MWEIRIFQRKRKKLHLVVLKPETKTASKICDVWCVWDTYVLCRLKRCDGLWQQVILNFIVLLWMALSGPWWNPAGVWWSGGHGTSLIQVVVCGHAGQHLCFQKTPPTVLRGHGFQSATSLRQFKNTACSVLETFWQILNCFKVNNF